MLKDIKMVITVLGIFAMTWVGISYIEVISQNLGTVESQLSAWNIFQLLFS